MGTCESKSEIDNIPCQKKDQKLEKTQLTVHNQEIVNRPNSNIVSNQFPNNTGRDKELHPAGNTQLPVEAIIKVMKAVCKITIINNQGEFHGTGFFMRWLDSKNYLVSNYHVLTQNGNIEIEIHNNKKMKLDFNENVNRDIKYYPDPKDIVIYEIKKYDDIYEDIEFLDYDLNYKKGYEIYKDADVFSIEYPLGNKATCSYGKIVEITEFQFYHTISTDPGSSGSPIILYYKNFYSIQVIGIHKEADHKNILNVGTFIGEIFNNDNIVQINNFNNINNYIIAEINIKDEQPLNR